MRTSKLVGIRHKGEAYIAKGHPTYGNVIETPGVIMQVDTIQRLPSPSGVANWMQLSTEMDDVTIEVRVRVEECDQFVYSSREIGIKTRTPDDPEFSVGR